jgi:hypothetical protein
LKTSAALKHFDLVAVWICHKEKPANQFSGGRKFDQFSWCKTFSLETRVLGIEIIDANGEVAITIAQIVRLGSVFVDCQL